MAFILPGTAGGQVAPHRIQTREVEESSRRSVIVDLRQREDSIGRAGVRGSRGPAEAGGEQEEDGTGSHPDSD